MLNAAEAILPQGGTWELNTVFVPAQAGLPIPITPKVSRLCLAPEDFVTSKFAVQSMPGCKVSAGQWEDKRLKLKLICESNYVQTAEGILALGAPTKLAGKVIVNMGKDVDGNIVEFTYKVDATRVADCAEAKGG